MSSFSKMSIWPVGYFRATSSWLLRNRKGLAARISVINAEINRIGFVRVSYYTRLENGEAKATEFRRGFAVTRDSSLGRLCQAYVANGGNPLDISPFLHPDSTTFKEIDADGNIKVSQDSPHGGVAAPRSAAYNEPMPKEGVNSGYGADPGGWIEFDRDYTSRRGGQRSRANFDFSSVVKTMHQLRGWANQEIKERLQDIEWRIIKLADLREQLIKERDEVLVEAFGGVLTGIEGYDEDRFDNNLRVQNLAQTVTDLLFDTTEGSFKPRPEVAFQSFTFDNEPSEQGRDPMGG